MAATGRCSFCVRDVSFCCIGREGGRRDDPDDGRTPKTRQYNLRQIAGVSRHDALFFFMFPNRMKRSFLSFRFWFTSSCTSLHRDLTMALVALSATPNLLADHDPAKDSKMNVFFRFFDGKVRSNEPRRVLVLLGALASFCCKLTAPPFHCTAASSCRPFASGWIRTLISTPSKRNFCIIRDRRDKLPRPRGSVRRTCSFAGTANPSTTTRSSRTTGCATVPPSPCPTGSGAGASWCP